ncbi:hypothetical protein QUH28_28180, partial [Klebsiella pneumoniae]|nr:hypothetical protein [Klebsiella pneumoniae]
NEDRAEQERYAPAPGEKLRLIEQRHQRDDKCRHQHADGHPGLILSWLSFSLTFFIRPIGGVIFAHIGDRIGRKKTLVLTLSL